MPRKSAFRIDALQKASSRKETVAKGSVAKEKAKAGDTASETQKLAASGAREDDGQIGGRLRRLVWWRRTPRPARPDKPYKMVNVFRVFRDACVMPLRHWEIFGGILLIYGAVDILLIGGLIGGEDIVAIKDAIASAFTGQFGNIKSGVALYGFLITDSGNTAAGGVAGAYQTMLLLMLSLTLIYALRHVYAGHKIIIRDAFYNGMQPLVKYLLVMLTIGLQLVPAVVGGFLFVVLSTILQHTYEHVIMAIILLLLIAASVYMLISSVFALYIVTLPDMTPVQALRSAREIVRYRRAKVLLMLLFLPLALLVISAVIMVPVSLLLTPITTYIFFALTLTGVLVTHSYLYTLYRELINEG